MASIASAQTGPAPDIKSEVASATVAIYRGKNVCKWYAVESLFGSDDVWGCKFESRFTCTGTVIRTLEDRYLVLTTGHCFDWDDIALHVKYFISDEMSATPVLHEAHVVKFENNDRYDFGLLTFESVKTFGVVPLAEPGTQFPAVGEKIYNAAYPFGVVKIVGEGTVVSKLVGPTEGGRCSFCKGRFLVDMRGGPGSSGSPIVNSNGEVVGLLEGEFTSHPMPMIVIPTIELVNFIDDDSVGIKPEAETPRPEHPHEGEAPHEETIPERFLHWLWVLFNPFYHP